MRHITIMSLRNLLNSAIKFEFSDIIRSMQSCGPCIKVQPKQVLKRCNNDLQRMQTQQQQTSAQRQQQLQLFSQIIDNIMQEYFAWFLERLNQLSRSNKQKETKKYLGNESLYKLGKQLAEYKEFRYLQCFLTPIDLQHENPFDDTEIPLDHWSQVFVDSSGYVHCAYGLRFEFYTRCRYYNPLTTRLFSRRDVMLLLHNPIIEEQDHLKKTELLTSHGHTLNLTVLDRLFFVENEQTFAGTPTRSVALPNAIITEDLCLYDASEYAEWLKQFFCLVNPVSHYQFGYMDVIQFAKHPVVAAQLQKNLQLYQDCHQALSSQTLHKIYKLYAQLTISYPVLVDSQSRPLEYSIGLDERLLKFDRYFQQMPKAEKQALLLAPIVLHRDDQRFVSKPFGEVYAELTKGGFQTDEMARWLLAMLCNHPYGLRHKAVAQAKDLYDVSDLLAAMQPMFAESKTKQAVVSEPAASQPVALFRPERKSSWRRLFRH